MPAQLAITARLQVTPLLNIQRPSFAKSYQDGIYWSLFKEQHTHPLSDSFLLKSIREALTEQGSDEQQSNGASLLGFHLGRMHGAILSSQTGTLRPDMLALAHFEHEQAKRGYDIGREWYFVESVLEQDERIATDTGLTARLQEIERESVYFHEEESTWYYTLGCLLGELSGQLFPPTPTEYARWKRDRRLWAHSESRPA